MISHKSLMRDERIAFNLAAMAAGAEDLDWDFEDEDDRDDDFATDEFPEEFWEQTRLVNELKRRDPKAQGMGTDAGEVGVLNMAPDLAEDMARKIREMGLG